MTAGSFTAEILEISRANYRTENTQNKVVVYHRLLNNGNNGNQYFFSIYSIPGDKSNLEKSLEDARGYVVNSPTCFCDELYSAVRNMGGTVRFAGDTSVDFCSKSPYVKIKNDADNIARLVIQVELALKEFNFS